MTTRRNDTEKIFIDLCEEYHNKILKYLYYTTRNIEDAKDLTQEVFALIYSRIDEVDKHPNPGGFIFQTAKYVGANFNRKQSRVTQHEAHLESTCDVSFGTTEDAYVELTKTQDASINENLYIDNVLNHISDDKQILYRLRYQDKKSYKEIATDTGINESSIRMKYVRLRQEIRERIHDVAKQYF